MDRRTLTTTVLLCLKQLPKIGQIKDFQSVLKDNMCLSRVLPQVS